jgi:hypothetical protein
MPGHSRYRNALWVNQLRETRRPVPYPSLVVQRRHNHRSRMDLFELSTRIAQELTDVLDKQRPWERPDALKPAEIATLTGLRCVTEAMSGRRNTFRGRVAALATVLRKALQEDPELRGSDRVRDALIYLGLDEDETLREATLTDRREEIARRRGIDVWTSPSGSPADTFRHTQEGPLRGMIALRLAEYEAATQEPAYRESADVLVFRTRHELADAAVKIIDEAGPESPAVYCVGCPRDSSDELFAITRALAATIKTRPNTPVTIVYENPSGEPGYSGGYIPVRATEASRLVLVGNEKQGFVCLPSFTLPRVMAPSSDLDELRVTAVPFYGTQQAKAMHGYADRMREIFPPFAGVTDFKHRPGKGTQRRRHRR